MGKRVFSTDTHGIYPPCGNSSSSNIISAYSICQIRKSFLRPVILT